MLTLLLGPDGYSKKEYISALSTKRNAKVRYFGSAEAPPDVSELITQDLFSAPVVCVLEGLLGKYASTQLQKLIMSGSEIIFIEEKLDKRTTASKELLAIKTITVHSFNLPHGSEFNHWINKKIRELQGSIEPAAEELLAIRLGRDAGKETKIGGKIIDSTEVFTLWQVESEIKKLLAYTEGKIITVADVENLVAQNGEVEVFDIINAVGDKRRKDVFTLLEGFLAAEAGSDEKGKIIQLNALLSDQFRNIAITQDYLDQRIPDAVILEKTGWKSGRLFVMKKISSQFQKKKVLDTLDKLSHLDEELKTGSVPPRVLLDLIIVQMFA